MADAELAGRVSRRSRFDLALYDQETPGALELASIPGPGSRPRVVIAAVHPSLRAQLGNKRVHFVLQKPVTADILTKTIKAAFGPIERSRRESFRHDVNIPLAKCKLLRNGEQHICGARIVNLSKSGLCVEAGTALPPGVTLELEFSLPVSGDSIVLNGPVVWSHASGRAGIKYDRMNEKLKQALHRWLEARLPGSEQLLPRAPILTETLSGPGWL
jgi:hypothetical protein